MEMDLRGRKCGASLQWCILFGWKKQGRGLIWSWQNPQTVLQITVGLLTWNLTSCSGADVCVCVWLHRCAAWTCFTTWIQYVTLGSIIMWVRAYVIFGNMFQFLTDLPCACCQHYVASVASYFSCPTAIGYFPMTSWTAIIPQCYGLFPEAVLLFRAIS